MEIIITLIALAFIEVMLAAAVIFVAGIISIFGCRFRRNVRRGLRLLAVPPLLILYGTFIGRNLYKTVPVEICSEEIPESFDGYRIVHISDIHLSSFRFRHESLSRVVRKINSLNPDMIAVTGDLITFNPDEIEGFDTILSSLNAADGVFSVTGNHDYCIYDRRSKAMAKEEFAEKVIEEETRMGWTVLMNGNAAISNGRDTIYIIGVENTSASDRFPSKGDLKTASAGTDGHFKILLSHDPTHWRMEVAGKSDIGLMLSGHTHAMQMSVFGWSPSSLIFKEYRGLYEYSSLNDKAENILVDTENKNVSLREGQKARGTAGKIRQYLYVNIGLGETGFPVRIGARPEITLITLRHAHVQNGEKACGIPHQ